MQNNIMLIDVSDIVFDKVALVVQADIKDSQVK